MYPQKKHPYLPFLSMKILRYEETEVKKIFLQLEPQSFEPINRDQQGFKVQLSNGRIDCLPGAVHLWCEITPEILGVLDGLFTKTFGLRPS